MKRRIYEHLPVLFAPGVARTPAQTCVAALREYADALAHTAIEVSALIDRVRADPAIELVSNASCTMLLISPHRDVLLDTFECLHLLNSRYTLEELLAQDAPATPAQPVWQRELPPMPTAGGDVWWWFYGTTAFERHVGKAAQYRSVRQKLAGGDAPWQMFVTDGELVYPGREGWEGWWCPNTPPPLPASEVAQ